MPRRLPAALPIEPVPAGTTLARIHWTTTVEPFFGPRPGDPPTHRFHDPKGEFGVCFLGENPTASFAETFLRRPPARLISRTALGQRDLTHFEVLRELRLTLVRDAGLAIIGCTAEITSSRPQYTAPQALSRELWLHPDQPDGIQYRCRHDNGLLAVALYDRARHALKRRDSGNLLDDHTQLLEWSRRYQFSIG